MVGRCYIGIDGWEFRWDKRVALGESSKSSSVLCYSVYIYWEALDILDVDTDGRLLAQKVMGIRNLAKNMLKMAGSGYRRFARSRLYEYILVVMRFYFCI